MISGENHVGMKDVTAKTFDREISSARASVVDFWAPWCMPCKKLSEVINQSLKDLQGTYQGKINFFKVNVDEETSLAQKFGIMTLPTVIGFSGTNPVERFTGRTKDEFIKWVQRLADRAGLLDE
ncbi:MAG: thioredoxin family protein [Bacillota bacterium]|jgi:thioredoxin 1